VQIQVPRLSSLQVSKAVGRIRRLIRHDWLRAWVMANRLFALALAAGTILRLVAVIGYPGALYFAGDSYVYLGAAVRLMPDRSKSTGYSLFLKLLEPFHSLTLVTIVQHLLGLAIAVMIYALLRRARVSKLWAALATLPVLLNSFQVELEHMVMADTLFMFLLVAAAALLLWHEQPSWRAVLLAGLLTGYAITVWVPGVLIAFVFLAFLIVRRKGWRSLAAIVAGCAMPAVAYVLWFHSRTGDYDLTDSGGFYLWGRVSSFAECSRINPPADGRMLCLSQPPSRREPPGDLIWHEPQVMAALPGGPVSAKSNALMENFAIRAIEAQPLSYVHVIIDGLVLAVEPVHHPYPSAGTVYDYYFHTKPQTVPDHSWIPGATAPQDIRAYGHASMSRVVEPFAFAMAAYQRVFWLYGPLLGLIMILGIGGFVRVTRRDGWRISIQRRHDGPSMMPWVAAVALFAAPIAIADFDYRYLLPAVPFACLAAGLAFTASVPKARAEGSTAVRH
jgi:4-amino-4-deoxy-L-arabinose transferase-like glycosyltransferase